MGVWYKMFDNCKLYGRGNDILGRTTWKSEFRHQTPLT